MCEFFIEPPPDTQRTEIQGERGIWVVVVLLSVVSSPPLHPPPPWVPFHLPAAMFIRIRRTRESPPPLTHLPPLDNSEAAAADLEDLIRRS
jgi:hypothetical protein